MDYGVDLGNGQYITMQGCTLDGYYKQALFQGNSNSTQNATNRVIACTIHIAGSGGVQSRYLPQTL